MQVDCIPGLTIYLDLKILKTHQCLVYLESFQLSKQDDARSIHSDLTLSPSPGLEYEVFIRHIFGVSHAQADPGRLKHCIHCSYIWICLWSTEDVLCRAWSMTCLLGIYLNFCTLKRTRGVQNTAFIAHIFEFVYDQRKMFLVTALSIACLLDINCEFSKSIWWFGSLAEFHNRNVYLI